jgi:hypothetical protein
MFIDYIVKTRKLAVIFQYIDLVKPQEQRQVLIYYKITANFLVCFNVLKKGLIFLGTALFMKKKN